MKACALIAHLSKLAPQVEVMILEGTNGGGVPRTINIGPREHIVTQGDADETYDCEHLVGVKVQTIGYGSY